MHMLDWGNPSHRPLFNVVAGAWYWKTIVVRRIHSRLFWPPDRSPLRGWMPPCNKCTIERKLNIEEGRSHREPLINSLVKRIPVYNDRTRNSDVLPSSTKGVGAIGALSQALGRSSHFGCITGTDGSLGKASGVTQAPFAMKGAGLPARRFPHKRTLQNRGITLCQTKGDAPVLYRFVYNNGDRHPINLIRLKIILSFF